LFETARHFGSILDRVRDQLVAELTGFPGSRYADQVSSTTSFGFMALRAYVSPTHRSCLPLYRAIRTPFSAPHCQLSMTPYTKKSGQCEASPQVIDLLRGKWPDRRAAQQQEQFCRLLQFFGRIKGVFKAAAGDDRTMVGK
jgi:hypothetical protein